MYQPQRYYDSPIIKGRPVTSVDEVKAALIDFDGSIFYFPDQANGCIYTKTIGLNGSSVIQMYKLAEMPAAPQIPTTQDYVTKVDFEKALASITEQLKQLKGGTPNGNAKPELAF